MPRLTTIASASTLLLVGCADYTGVHVQPDYVKAEQLPSEWDAAVPAQATVAAQPPKAASGRSGADAIARAQKEVKVRPRQSEIQGTTWRIDDIDTSKIYTLPVAPLSVTTIFLPIGESLGQNGAAVGSAGDFTTTSNMSGDRSAVSIMPKCAPQGTKRFARDDSEETPFIRPCLTNIAKLTLLTNAFPYNFELQVNDWTAASIVEINHAAPPPTNLVSLKQPKPTGPVEELLVFPEGKWNPGWGQQIRRAWADPDKMVIEFVAPLPTQPDLYPLGGNVNYSVIETPQLVWMVTSRRVTEAKLILDEQVIRISSQNAEELLANQNSPRPKDWRD
jgi:hypothetical protein